MLSLLLGLPPPVSKLVAVVALEELLVVLMAVGSSPADASSVDGISRCTGMGRKMIEKMC